MRFLVDAQLPRRLSHQLRAAGHDALHTLDLPRGNRTTDEEITARAEAESRVVITKDADFVNSLVLFGRPSKLVLISAGNLSNADLERLLASQLHRLIGALEANDFVEITASTLIVHG